MIHIHVFEYIWNICCICLNIHDSYIRINFCDTWIGRYIWYTYLNIYGGAVAEWIGSRSFSTVVLGSISVAVVGTRDHNWINFLSIFLTVLRWFPQSTPISSTWQNCEGQNSNLIISWFGPVISLPFITEKKSGWLCS